MKSPKINDVLKQWRAEAGVRTPIMYKTFSPRDSDILWIYITTDQPLKMKVCFDKYYHSLARLNLFNKKLEIQFEKADQCIF